MKKLRILLVLALLIYTYAAHSAQHDEMDELFGGEEEADVIIVLNDDYVNVQQSGIKAQFKQAQLAQYDETDDFKAKKAMIRKQQEGIFKEIKVKKKDSKSKGLSVQAAEDYDFDLKNSYSTVNGFSGRLKKSSYAKLKNNPRVKMIYKPKPVSLFLNDAKGIVNATETWRLVYNEQNITGKGETVCVIDTGVDYTHSALGGCTQSQFLDGNCGKVISGYDYINNDDDPADDHWHGTHVAGIVASNDPTYTGIAPEANIVGLKVLNAAGGGTSSNVAAGIDWCVNNATKFNISVISMSLGGGQYTSFCDSADPLIAAAINTAVGRNISVVVATGNTGTIYTDEIGGIASPACIANSTRVTAVDKSDSMASFAFRHSNFPDILAATGVSITSLKATGTATPVGCSDSGIFRTCSGTSMAAPMTSGAFALLKQFKRLESSTILTPLQIQQKLNDTGKIIDDTGGSGLQFSRINVYAALLALDTAPNITFTNPTPLNNTRILVDYTFINITSNEILLNATLEWNGTNETMEGSGTNWRKNKTNLSVASVPYIFKVWGNDTSGNMAVTELRTLIFNNTLPVTDSFQPEILVFSIAEPDNQTFNITAHDNEGNTLNFNWYKNSSLAASSSNYTFLGNYTSAGFYNITVIISDGDLSASKQWNFSVNNTNRGINITSTPATDAKEKRLYNYKVTAADPDNDVLVYSDNTTLFDIDSSTGLISFTPTTTGTYTILINITDGIETAAQIYNLTIGSISNALKISLLNLKNDSTINTNSTWLNISTDKYGNCTYNLDSEGINNFNISTADYWKVETSKKLELSQELVNGNNVQTIRNVTTFIDESDLKNALLNDLVSNLKGDSQYNQYLYLLGRGTDTALDTGYVIYTEDNVDFTSDFLYFKVGKEIGRYLLEFVKPLKTDIKDDSGNIAATGLHLTDFENVDIKFFNKKYTIIKASRTSQVGNNINLTLMSNAIKDTLLDGNTGSYDIAQKKYNITVNFVSSTQAQFVINQQNTPNLNKNQFHNITSDVFIYVYDILYQDFAGGIHSATFYIGKDKMDLSDSYLKDRASTHSLIVNNKLIDDAYVIIEGQDNNSSFNISRIHINMTADANFYIPVGERLSESSNLTKPEVLLTNNWDISYGGLTAEPIEKIHLVNSGTGKYDVRFVDAAGYKVSLPVAESTGGSILLFGRSGKDFINAEASIISKDDYLILTNSSMNRSLRPTYALQYKGAEKISIEGHLLKFKNLGDGTTIELAYTDSTPLAYLNLNGTRNAVYLAAGSDISQNDFNIMVDLDGDGTLNNDLNANTIITTKYGAEINLTNQTDNNILFSIRTPDDNNDMSKNISNIQTVEAIINITNNSGNTTVNSKDTIKIFTLNNAYYLDFFDRTSSKVNLPIAENDANNNIFFGQINKSLINKETGIIKKNYYFVVTDISQDRGKRWTYALQYLGADKITADSPVLRFKILGSGEVIQQSYTDSSPLYILKLGGQDFKVYKSPSADISINDFDIQIDLDGDGLLSSDNSYFIPITTSPNGVEINLTNETLPNTVQLIFRTFDTIINETIKTKNNVNSLYPSILMFNISANSGMVNHTRYGSLNFRIPNGEANSEYAYTSYGAFIRRYFPAGEPPTLDIDYPIKQRIPLVYYESGGEHSKLLSDLKPGKHSIDIACQDIFNKNTTTSLVFTYSLLSPKIISHFPLNQSVNASVKTNIMFNSSKKLDNSTLALSKISIKDDKGEKINGVIFYNGTINQTVFDPIHFLKFNTTYIVNITKNIKDISGNNLESDYVWTFTTALKDTDGDGIPDDEDTDKDNDGIDDTIDFLKGNVSNINNNFANMTLFIDSDFNISKAFNGTKKIEFRNGDRKLLEFDFNFSNNTQLDFTNLSVLNASNSTIGAAIVKGIDLSQSGFKKTLLVEKIDSNLNGICIKDAEIDWIDNISSSCNSANEYKIECDGTSQNGYTCTYNSTIDSYQVSGLSHSGVIQYSYTKPASGGDSNNQDSSSSVGGGGGGGGGGSPFYICSMEWKCEEWSTCANGRQVRSCSYIKVPQHSQSTICHSSDKPPESSKTCAEAKLETAKKSETCSDGIKNQNEGGIDCGGVCRPCANNAASSASKNQTQSPITGLAVEKAKLPPMWKLTITIVAVLFPLASYGYHRWRKKSKNNANTKS